MTIGGSEAGVSEGPEQLRWGKRLKALEADGLRFISHTFVPSAKDVTAEELYADMNALQDAIERGDTEPLDFVDKHLPQRDVRGLLG